MKKNIIAQKLLKNSEQYGAKYQEFIQTYIRSFETIKKQEHTQDQETRSLQNFDACLSYLESESSKSIFSEHKLNEYGLFKIGYDMFCIANNKEKIALILAVFNGKVHISSYGGTCPWDDAEKNDEICNVYTVIKNSFMGGKEIFSSEDKKIVAKELIKLKAYKQPIMRDAGFTLLLNKTKLDIDEFIKQNLSENEIATYEAQNS